MYHATNEKWKKTNVSRNRTTKLRKNQNTWRKGNLQVLGNTGGGHHQTMHKALTQNASHISIDTYLKTT